MRSVHLVAIELCRFLEEERIDYALLGDACLPSSSASHRIELVVSPGVLEHLPFTLHKFCLQSDSKLVTCEREERQGWRCLLSWLNRDERPEFVSIEVFSDWIRGGRTLLAGRELLKERFVEAGQLRLHPAFFVASPAMEFIYYLLRCTHESVLTDEQGQHLSDCWKRDPTASALQLSRFFDAHREGGVIARAAESGEWDTARELMPLLRSRVRRSRRVRVLDWIHERLQGMRRWLQPTGLLLAFLGPQGVGKASVIDALRDRPLSPFVNVHAMELRPKIFRANTKDPLPHEPQQQPRGRSAAIAKLIMFAADYWLGYYGRIRPKLVRTMLVVFNRYYDDVLVNPQRYRMAKPPFAFARALLPWIPRPDLWLVLDAPYGMLSSRNSLSEEESSRQRGEYRRLLRGYENVVVLDARQPLDKLVAQAERAIVAHLGNRTAERLRLPLSEPKNPLSTTVLLYLCRRNVPILSRLVRVLFNSDIYCRLPAHIYMPHPYGIIIHPQAALGERITVMQQVAIGDKDQGEGVAPVIGNDVYIGAGARVLGDVRIGDGVTIGANAVVTRDIPAGATVVGANRIVSSPAPATSTPSVTPFRTGTHKGA